MKRLCAVVGMLLVCAWTTGAFGAVVKEVNLEYLCAGAGRIFAGVCVGSTSEYDDATGSPVFLYSFKPSRIFKGDQSDIITMKVHASAITFARAPKFNVGDSVVLFLYPESDKGFTTPVGFGQGKFYVKTSPQGFKTVVNERNNINLFKGMAPQQYAGRVAGVQSTAALESIMTQAAGAIEHAVFVSLIETILQ